MKKYTFEELSEMTEEDLETVKREKQHELYLKKQEKYLLITNILSLQNMIEEE